MAVTIGREKVAERALYYALLMRLDRPIGILLLLWPTLWALWLAAEGVPDAGVLLVFVVGVVLMRSAGCVINDLADRRFDPHVRRTRARPIASGAVSVAEALALFAVLCLIALGLVATLNRLTLLLAGAALVLAATYPFMKRYTYLPQVYLGITFGWAVPMAFAAQTGAVPKVAWLLFIANVLWATAYDTMYAMVDREDDMRIGVRSTAILFGAGDRPMIAFIQALAFVTLVIVGTQKGLGIYYYLGLAAAAGLALYQQFLIRERDPARCFRAFANNGWFGGAIFAGIVLHYLPA